MSAALQGDVFCDIGRRRERRPLREIVGDLGYGSDWNWAWNSYGATILRLSREYGLSRHLEIGGGRDTLFTPAEARRTGSRSP